MTRSPALALAFALLVGVVEVHAQNWNPFRTASARNDQASPQAPPTSTSVWPHWNLPRLQMPFAPAEPGTPPLSQRFNQSAQRFLSKTKEVVTAPIDAVSQKTSELTQFFQPASYQSAPRQSVFGSSAPPPGTKPETVNEWLAQPRPE